MNKQTTQGVARPCTTEDQSTPEKIEGWFASLPVLILLLALPPILAAFLLLSYGNQFPIRFAKGQDVWGQFGDFLGGVLNPLVAWITLFIVAISLRQTVRAIEHSLKEVHREQQSEKERRTFQVHQVWISAEMQDLRTAVWEFFNDAVRSADEREQTRRALSEAGEPPAKIETIPAQGAKRPKPVFIGQYRISEEQEERRLYYSLGSISHFMADTVALLDAGMLDQSLCKKLLGRSLKQWYDLYERLDFRVHEKDHSSQSKIEVDLHKNALRGLKEFLGQE
jgi:hypothetical protein